MFELPRRYNRDPFPGIPAITSEELLGKHFGFKAPKNQEERIISFLTNTSVKSAIVGSWSESTKYPENSQFGPAKKYEYTPGMPNGQCGVTAMTLGIAMVQSGLAPPEKIFYEEGKLLNARGEIIDDHHAWLRIEGDEDDKEWIIDLTSYQYEKALTDPDQLINVVVKGVHHWVGHYAGINTRYEDPYKPPEARRIIPVPNAISLTYEVDEIDGTKCSTPISKYNASLFEGRLERFNYKYTKRLGSFALTGELWHPPYYDSSKETWNPNEDIDIVYKETNIHAILEPCTPFIRTMWAHDCAAHALVVLKDTRIHPELHRTLALLEKSLRDDIPRREIIRAANTCLDIIDQPDVKHDGVAENLTRSVEQALRTVIESSSLRTAKAAATSVLWATFHNDTSDLKMSVVKEFEWQKRHLDLIVEQANQEG